MSEREPSSPAWSLAACLSVVRLAHNGCGIPPSVPEEAADALCTAALQSINEGLFRHLWILDCTQQAQERLRRIMGSSSARGLDQLTFAVCSAEKASEWTRAVVVGSSLSARSANERHREKLCVYLSPGALRADLAERCDRAVLRVLPQYGIPTVTAGALRTFWDT